MIVTLSGGHEAEIREELTGGDRKAARKAVSVRVGPDGSRDISMAIDDEVKQALMRRLIIRWDIPGLPLPRDAENPGEVFDRLPIEDLEALEEAVQPAFDRILGRAGPKQIPSSNEDLPTGSSGESPREAILP